MLLDSDNAMKTMMTWESRVSLKALVAVSGLVTLVICSSLRPAEAALSAGEFAKCRKMMEEQTDWLIARGDQADEAFDRKVDTLIEKYAGRQGDPDAARLRMQGAVDRVIKFNDRAGYRKDNIEGPTVRLGTPENADDFRCWKKSRLRRALKDNALDYEFFLEQLEKAVKERIELEDLEPDEGLVVVLFYARGRAEKVRIDRLGSLTGGITFGPVLSNDYFRVVKAKAGTYRWHSVTNRVAGYWYKTFMKRAKLDFEVDAGKLNYVGAFLYEGNMFGGYRMDVFDRASVLLSLLEDRYPEMLDGIEFRNGLNSENRFIDFYLQERRKLQAENEDG
jgi:hypothetical protein